MKNCDTCKNFTKMKKWQNRAGLCDRNDWNIVQMKGKPCKDYRRGANNKRKRSLEEIQQEIKEFAERQKPIDVEFVRIVNNDFWDLLTK